MTAALRFLSAIVGRALRVAAALWLALLWRGIFNRLETGESPEE